MERVDEGDRKGVGERIGERNSGVVTYDGVEGRGETIHRNYGASRFSGHDSVHDSFSPSFDTVRFTQV